MQFITEYSKITCIEDGKEVGCVTYPETENGIFTIDHTFVDESMQGKGIAAKLVQLALNDINMRGGEVRASCSYAKRYIEKHGLRPVVICHMVTSIDGKVTGDFLYSEKGLQVSESYYEINRMLKGDAFACGRVTMESSFTGGWYPDLTEYPLIESKDDFIPDNLSGFYAVSFDPKGKLGWKSNKIIDEDPGYNNAQIIEVLTEQADGRYLGYLQAMDIPYIFAGETEIDVHNATAKLYSLTGISSLLLEGGSIVNGYFERAGVIDELSLVVAPIVADAEDKPLFMASTVSDFELKEIKKYKSSVIWLNYKRK